jgi:hypothetical protein
MFSPYVFFPRLATTIFHGQWSAASQSIRWFARTYALDQKNLRSISIEGSIFMKLNLMTLHFQNSPSSVFPPVFNDVHALTSVFPANWRWLFFTCKCCHHPICRWIRWQASNIPVRTSHSQADSACPHERQRDSTVCVMRTGDYSLIPDYQQQKRASSMFNAVGWSHWYVPNPKYCCKSSI